MESVFILSNESRIVKATMSLDEATLWTNSGGFMVEVPFTGGTELLSYIDDNQEIQIQIILLHTSRPYWIRSDGRVDERCKR